MRARQLIAGATFDPDQLKVIRKAFDDVWAQVAPQISRRPDAIEASRLKLASIVLSVAKRGTLDYKQLAEEAMKLMFPRGWLSERPSGPLANLALGTFGAPITVIGRRTKQPLEKLHLFLRHGNA